MSGLFSLWLTAILFAGEVPTPIEGVPVAIDNIESASLPPLTKIKRSLPDAKMTRLISEILKKEECTIPGNRPKRFNIVSSYAALLGADGSLKKLVIDDMQCRPIEMLSAKIVAAQANRGDFIVGTDNEEQWFGGDIQYQVGRWKGQTVASDPDKVSCRGFPRVGSRIKVDKMCKTAAEWAEYEDGMLSLRRDMLRSGECAGAQSCAPDYNRN